MNHPSLSEPALIVRHTGQVVPLALAPLSVGRQPDNTIVLSDPQVSRYHATISRQGNAYVVKDLGSANGTYVNERRTAESRPLRDGDVIRMGNTLFDVDLSVGPAAAAAARDPGSGVAGHSSAPSAGPAPSPRNAELDNPELIPGAGPAGRSALPTVMSIALAALILFCLGATATVVWLSVRGGKPVVSFQSPVTGQEVAVGQEILLRAAASGARNIGRLELSVDGVLVASTSSADPKGQPALTVSQRWVFLEAGSHLLSATAFTARGEAGEPAMLEILAVAAAGQPTPEPAVQTPTPPPATATPGTGEATSPLPPATLPADTPTATDTATFAPTLTLSPTPTSTPTATPTLTPTPTGLPLPVIAFFRANPDTVSVGKCSNLEWGLVSNATSAAIDQGIGGVGTPGSLLLCPPQTTTYLMTAVGVGGVVTATATITVSIPAAVTLRLTSEPLVDGYVIGGQAPYNGLDLRLGNIAAVSGERVFRGFLSFDLAGLPAGATIQGAQLRIFQVEVIGDPYGKLGQVLLQHLDYGSGLDTGDFGLPALDSTTLSPQPLPGTWYSLGDTPLAGWITQDRAAGRVRFQLRLQFATETDDGATSDYARLEAGDNSFGTGNLPELVIVYTP